MSVFAKDLSVKFKNDGKEEKTEQKVEHRRSVPKQELRHAEGKELRNYF